MLLNHNGVNERADLLLKKVMSSLSDTSGRRMMPGSVSYLEK